MLGVEDRIYREAIDWLISLRDPASANWAGFTAWLEADPAHNDAYERAALADQAIATALPGADASKPVPVSNDNEETAPRTRRYFLWSAAAAAAVTAVLSVPLLQQQNAAYSVQTAAGEHRAVTLDDGTRIELNGNTQLSLNKGSTRYATLERGEATFTVVHDDANPFVVKIGDDRIQDVGTTFNVVRSPDATEISVSEGKVLFNPDKEAIPLKAGQSLRFAQQGQTAVVGSVDPASVASWRAGRLVYRDAPLAKVAADLSRNIGVDVAVAPEIADRPFSGVIVLAGDRNTLIARVGALLDVQVEQIGGSWRLVPGVHARS